MSDLVFSLLCLLVSLLIFTAVGYANWYGNTKERIVFWIGKNISKPIFGEERFGELILKNISFGLVIVSIILVFPLLSYLGVK